jgi:hypothetical protein
VRGCRPGSTMETAGDDWWCVMNEPTNPGGGGGGGGGGDRGSGELGGGPTGGGSADPQWDKPDLEEAKKRWRCSQCKVNGERCVKRTRKVEERCVARGADAAKWRCDMSSRQPLGMPTITPWGCSIRMHHRGECQGVDAPWDKPKQWYWECEGGGGKEHTCKGSGIGVCEQSWAFSHPSGSKQVTDKASMSVMFDGIGPSAEKTVSATYEVTGSTGYVAACAAMNTLLEQGCAEKTEECLAEFKCDDE